MDEQDRSGFVAEVLFEIASLGRLGKPSVLIAGRTR